MIKNSEIKPENTVVSVCTISDFITRDNALERPAKGMAQSAPLQDRTASCDTAKKSQDRDPTVLPARI